MGVYTDILAGAKSWDSGVGDDGLTVATDRVITKHVKAFLARQGDLAYPSGFEADDEVQSVATFPITVESGNFTLTVTLRSEETFTTANIAYDAAAATIEGAINTAATGNITGWTNGDISVTLGTDLNAGALTLTFDGTSVKETNQGTVVMTDADLFSDPSGAVTTVNEGVEPVNEVQEVAIYVEDTTSGNYTLELNIAGQGCTTANIAYDANAATIETAIDVTATNNAVPGWVNGDVSVSGGPLTTTPLVLTYDGTSSAGTDPVEVVIANVDLVGGIPGAESTTTPGVVAVNEVQEFAICTENTTAGNFTLELNIAGQGCTTANIAHDAVAATIETAIDVTATNNAVPGWVNGDVTVSGGPLTTTPLVLTYDGTSSAGTDPVEVVIANIDLVGGIPGAESTTTPGVVAVDEVQEFAIFTENTSAGNYTLAFNVGAQAFTTASLLYDDVAATIETAIDVSATANAVPAWINGDITVSGGPLSVSPLVLTFDGNSTAGTDAQEVVIANVDLVGGVPGAESTTTPGVVGVDEIQQIGVFGGAVDGGNYSLTLNINGTEVTTANIIWNGAAAVIEGAINTVATGNVGSWTNGDVTVAGGDMNTATVNFTYDGACTDEFDVPIIVANDVDLANGTLNTPSTLTPGVAPVNEVQEIGVYVVGVTGGNYTLTLNMAATEVTTASVLWNANAATIEGAINTVATGNVAGWVNGDVSVSGGDMASNPVVLTYDGANVAGTDIVASSISDVDLAGGVPGAASTTTPGVAPVNEVQEIAAYVVGVTGGNYTLTLNMAATEITTASILWNANAAAIEGAINTAATGNVSGWVNGDVSVSGGDLVTNPVVLTYDGTNVASTNIVASSISDVDLDGGVPGAASTTTPGVAPVNEVQEIAAYVVGVTGGNYTLTLNLNSTAVTTANLTYNANAGAVETAIDTVATGNVADWVNGDVSVSGGHLGSANVVLTYDGANYAGTNPPEVTISDVDLDGGVPGAASTTTPGVVPVDEGMTVAAFVDTVTSGNYTLEFTMSDLTNLTTANIAYDANAATIETAIDTVFTGNYGAWTNGDITIGGGPLTTNAITIVYDGNSVDELNHADPIIDSVDLAGHTTMGVESVTTYGQSDRTTMAALEVMGLVATGGPPPQGTTSGIVAASTRASNPWYPSQETLQALAQQASIEDGSDDVYVALMTTFGLAHLL